MTPDPQILFHPNIPKPLHGISPRVVKGKAWWDEVRMKAYKKAEYRCEACGVSKDKADFHPWLEAHEVYDYDYEKCLLTFSHLVALCHSCHNYIHSGRMWSLLDSGEMDEDKFKFIMQRGDILVALFNKPLPVIIPASSWSKWRMSIDGKLYGPSAKSYVDWKNGEWKNWSCKEAEK